MGWDFSSAFDSATEWLVGDDGVLNTATKWAKSDAGSEILGAAIGAGGEYYASKEIAEMQAKHAKELSRQEHEQRIQFNDHLQSEKDERNQWANSDLAELDYTMGADRTLSGRGVLATNPNVGILPNLKGGYHGV
jgi:hypothetical protein